MLPLPLLLSMFLSYAITHSFTHTHTHTLHLQALFAMSSSLSHGNTESFGPDWSPFELSEQLILVKLISTMMTTVGTVISYVPHKSELY